MLSRLDVEYFKNLAKTSKVLNPFYRLAAQSFIDFRFPKHLFIETTSICNLRCITCDREPDKNKNGHMDFRLFQKIVNEASTYGPRSFCLHLFGEPLLHPQIVDMVKYIKSVNSRHSILLTTNGLLLSKKMFRDLAAAKLDRISVSVLATNKETYHKITGSKRYDLLESNLLSLPEIRKNEFPHGTRVYLRYLVGNETKDELKSFIDKWEGTGLKLEIRPRHNLGGKYKGTNIPSEVFKNRWPCYHVWFAPGIAFNGDFTVCCNDPRHEAVIGNVNESTVAELWKGEKMNRIRQFHKSARYDKISICKNCDVWSIYPDIFFKFQKR
ncbi:MAG: hypothetical protein AMK70_02615 [Nitrospira bacterium SG8_35_1]|nr:MAG: hypothetical protein AMK70_02615 [Nitrospira bacterium SG8_35_1]